MRYKILCSGVEVSTDDPESAVELANEWGGRMITITSEGPDWSFLTSQHYRPTSTVSLPSAPNRHKWGPVPPGMREVKFKFISEDLQRVVWHSNKPVCIQLVLGGAVRATSAVVGARSWGGDPSSGEWDNHLLTKIVLHSHRYTVTFECPEGLQLRGLEAL